jgi:hypothetical protein
VGKSCFGIDIPTKCVWESDSRGQISSTLAQLLHPSNFTQYILYPTPFCCKGMGYRSLTAGELAQAFGFPIFCRVGGFELRDFDSFLPTQLLLSILDSPGLRPLAKRSVRGDTLPFLVQPRLPVYQFPCSTWSWIPAVGHWLYHEWIDISQVSSKAAKRDDAQIATAMWHKHILLLYPACTVAVFSRLRPFLLSYCRRLLLKSFCGFLRTRFGASWVALLLQARSAQDQLKLSPCHQGRCSARDQLTSSLCHPFGTLRMLLQILTICYLNLIKAPKSSPITQMRPGGIGLGVLSWCFGDGNGIRNLR